MSPEAAEAVAQAAANNTSALIAAITALIVALTTLLGVIGGLVLQFKNLRSSQGNREAIEAGNVRTDQAATASETNSKTLRGVLTQVDEVKKVVVAKVENVEKRIDAVHADVTNIAVDQAERVTDLTAQLRALK